MTNHSSPENAEALAERFADACFDSFADGASWSVIYHNMLSLIEALRAPAQCALTDDQQYALERMAAHDLQSVIWDNDRLLIQSAAQAAKDVLCSFTSTDSAQTADQAAEATKGRLDIQERVFAKMEAPRFYIDHGMIHDRVTGKHVTTDGEPPFEDSIEQVCELLNSLGGPAVTRPSWDGK